MRSVTRGQFMPRIVDLHKLLPQAAPGEVFMTVASGDGRWNVTVPQVPQVASGASQQKALSALTSYSPRVLVSAAGRKEAELDVGGTSA